MYRRVWFSGTPCLLLAVSLFALLNGCGGGGGGEGKGTGDGEGAKGPAKVKKVSAAELPKLADYLPPLEQGRVEIAPPADWNVLSRSNKYVAGFYFKDRAGPPRMLVTAEDTPIEGLPNVNEENLEEFCKKLSAYFEEQGKKLLEPVVPVVLGKTPWARFVQAGKTEKFSLERQVLQTVQDGRLYTLELQVFPKTLLKHRDSAYAVAAGMKFSSPAGSVDPPAEPPSSEE